MYIIFGLDGVLADNSERIKFIESNPTQKQRYFEDAIFDKPIKAGITLLRCISTCYNWTKMWDNDDDFISIVTGRPESNRTLTQNWLRENYVDLDFSTHLFMRDYYDTRPEYLLKEEYGKKIGYENIFLAIESDSLCCQMWKSYKVHCYQVI